jgi:uncharacterized protein (DUF3084 family)
MSGLFLIIILILASGLIAYTGDYVGRKAGKKKLSLFGLRPKYTSRIISILTGVLVMAFSLVVLSVISENVRVALFGMEKLKRQIYSLESSIKSKEKEYTEILKRYEDVKRDREKALKDLEEYKRKIQTLETEREKLLKELNKLSMDKERLKKENERLQRSIYEVSKKIATLSKEKESLEKDKKYLLDELQFLNSTITSLRTEGIIFKRGELILNYIIRGKTGDDIQKEAKALLSLIESIAKERGAGNEEKGYVWVPEAEWNKLLEAMKTPEEKLVRVFSLANIFEGEPVIVYFQIFPYKLVYKAGDVILLKVIDGSEGLDKIESKLLEVLSEVNKIAQQKGILPDPLSNTVGEISFDEFYNTAYKIKEKGKKVILKVIVEEDTYNSGPLKIRFEI